MFFAADGSPLPEELAHALQSQHERSEMSAEITRHEVMRFLDELSVDQIGILRMLLGHCSHDKNGRYSSYLEGLISGVLHYHHSVCAGCGKKHSDASDLTEDVPASDGTAQLSLFEPEAINEEEYLVNLLKWNMRKPILNEVESGEGDRPVICVGCGMLYQSLEDRMLREPGVGGCSGCQHKAAHG